MQKLKNKKIFVTGGGGFIGSHLVDKLVRKGIDVRVFVRYNSRNDWGMIDSLPLKIKKAVDVYQGDLKDPWSVKKALEGCNVVFHLGALIAIPYSYMNPIDFVQTNVLGTAYLLRACLDTGIERFIHTSTSEVYGTAQYVPIDEAHPLTAQSPYSATKIAADKLVESFYRTYKLPTVTVRPFNTYGPGQSARAIVPTIITQALTRKTIKLGSLTPTRDLTYVSDTVYGFILAAVRDEAIGEVINLGNGKEISIGDLARKIKKLLKKNLRITQSKERVRPVSSEVDRLLAHNQKAKDLLGWSPKINIDTGLTNTIEWIKKNIDDYKSEIYNV